MHKSLCHTVSHYVALCRCHTVLPHCVALFAVEITALGSMSSGCKGRTDSGGGMEAAAASAIGSDTLIQCLCIEYATYFVRVHGTLQMLNGPDGHLSLLMNRHTGRLCYAASNTELSLCLATTHRHLAWRINLYLHAHCFQSCRCTSYTNCHRVGLYIYTRKYCVLAIA